MKSFLSQKQKQRGRDATHSLHTCLLRVLLVPSPDLRGSWSRRRQMRASWFTGSPCSSWYLHTQDLALMAFSKHKGITDTMTCHHDVAPAWEWECSIHKRKAAQAVGTASINVQRGEGQACLTTTTREISLPQTGSSQARSREESGTPMFFSLHGW